MFYDRKIRYLDYYEAGERIRGCGFAKLEARDKTLLFEVSVKGLRDVDGAFPIFLSGAEKETLMGEVTVQGGNGSFRYRGSMEGGIGGDGISYEELCGIRIPLTARREVICLWGENLGSGRRHVTGKKSEEVGHGSLVNGDREQEAQKVDGSKESGRYEKERQHEEVSGGSQESGRNAGDKQERRGQKGAGAVSGGRQEQGRQESEKVRNGSQDNGMQEQDVQEMSMQENRYREKKAQASGTGRDLGKEEKTTGTEAETGTPTSVMRLHEDKWIQLCAVYPHIRPFHDEREYLSVRPADFVILPEADYRTAHNSFLLHGYYNYQHLILARVERRGEILYYLGAPGNYYEKEKQVAVMFGFESFECAEEPADYGDFGYYMMRVRI